MHALISQLALDRAKTILENSDFWSGPGSARTSAEAVTILRTLAGDPQEETAKPAKVAVEKPTPAPAPAKPAPKLALEADESKPADV